MPSLDDVPYKGPAHEVLLDLTTHISYVLVARLAIPEQQAQELGQEAARLLLRSWNGTTVYFPRGLVIDETHWRIYQEFDGTNIHALASKYGVTDRWVERVVQRMRRIDIRRRQCDLFPESKTDQGAR